MYFNFNVNLQLVQQVINALKLFRILYRSISEIQKSVIVLRYTLNVINDYNSVTVN